MNRREAILAGDFKLIEFYEDGRLELYDLKRDIGEQENLAAKMPEKPPSFARCWTTGAGRSARACRLPTRISIRQKSTSVPPGGSNYTRNAERTSARKRDTEVAAASQISAPLSAS